MTPKPDFMEWFNSSAWQGAGKDAGELGQAAWNAGITAFCDALADRYDDTPDRPFVHVFDQLRSELNL